jgi:hypothetical protein
LAPGNQDEIIDLPSPDKLCVGEHSIDRGQKKLSENTGALTPDRKAEGAPGSKPVQEPIHQRRNSGLLRNKVSNAILYPVMVDVLVKARDVRLNDNRPLAYRIAVGNRRLAKCTPRGGSVEEFVALNGKSVGMSSITASWFMKFGDGDSQSVEIEVPEGVNLGGYAEPCWPRRGKEALGKHFQRINRSLRYLLVPLL